RAVCVDPGRVRTWAAGAAPLDAEYEWHQAAKLWQTPGVGEAVMEKSTPEAMAKALAAAGGPPHPPPGNPPPRHPTMKRCILALYRSAVHVGREWEGDLARITAPGLVLWGTTDPYAAARFGERLAARVRARFVALDCSHWWQLERPTEVAAHLEKFWAG